MKVGINIDQSVKDIEVLITSKEQDRTVEDLYQYIINFDKCLKSFIAYKDDKAMIVHVNDVYRIFASNQKVYIQTDQGDLIIRYRLYELETMLNTKHFLRISHSEIVNINKIEDIDLSIIGRICIRFTNHTQTYVSRRYIPKIKKSLGI